jgi:hypothetical protein
MKTNIILSLLIITNFSVLIYSQTYVGTWTAKENIGSYNLHQGTGERMTTVSIKFPAPFEKTPEVMLSVTQLDASSKANVRYNVEIMNADKNGFKIKIRTWADTQLYSISGFWLAKGD